MQKLTLDVPISCYAFLYFSRSSYYFNILMVKYCFAGNFVCVFFFFTSTMEARKIDCIKISIFSFRFFFLYRRLPTHTHHYTCSVLFFYFFVSFSLYSLQLCADKLRLGKFGISV